MTTTSSVDSGSVAGSAVEESTAAETLAASLRAHGVDRVFCVAGESYLAVLDAMGRSGDIDVVTCRHEGSAGFMALADAKLTGRVGVCLASRGPGAANAAVAVHAAAEDAVPLILIVGGVPLGETDREPFQALDAGQFFGGIAKAVWTLTDPAAAGECVARAVRVAESGTPGPVVLTVPEDVLEQRDRVGVVTRRGPGVVGQPGPDDLDRVGQLLAGSRRPLLIAGASLDTPAGRSALRAVAERHCVPVVTANKRQHLLPNRHRLYAGHLNNSVQPAQLAALTEADLVLAVGTRLDGTTTGSRRFPAGPAPAQPLVHVYPDAARLGAFHDITVGCAADPVAFLNGLRRFPGVGSAPTVNGSDVHGDRAGWAARLHQIEVDKSVWHPVDAADGVVFGAVTAAVDELTGGDVTVIVDSGVFTSWVYRYIRFGARGRLVGISSSTMGFGVGAGIAAALRYNGTPTVVFVGDGGFLMNSGDFMTACALNLPVIYVVANNGSYGTIRLHQERRYPGRTVATDLTNPDFAALAEACGAMGLTVDEPGQVRPCLAKALQQPGPKLLDVRTSLQHITAYRRLRPDASA